MAGVSALVAAAVLLVGALSIYTLNGYVTAVSDTEVMHSLAAFKHSFTPVKASRSPTSLANPRAPSSR